MCNVVNKRAVAAVLVTALLAGCSGSGTRELAESLYTQAESALDEGRYAEALSLTDSIKNACPDQIDIRRQSLHIAARANEGLTLRRLEQADSLFNVTGIAADSLSRLVKKVDNPVEPYFVSAKVDPASVQTTTGLQARMSPDGHFYVISTLTGRSVKSTSVSVSDGSASATTSTVAFDGERNDRSGGKEIITFVGAECDSLGRFVSENRHKPLTVTFHGEKDYSMPMPAAQIEAMATLRDYYEVTRKATVAALEKERLTRALDLARSQAARTFTVPETNEK